MIKLAIGIHIFFHIKQIFLKLGGNFQKWVFTLYQLSFNLKVPWKRKRIVYTACPIWDYRRNVIYACINNTK